jgi:hypothetical protein
MPFPEEGILKFRFFNAGKDSKWQLDRLPPGCRQGGLPFAGFRSILTVIFDTLDRCGRHGLTVILHRKTAGLIPFWRARSGL